MVCERAARFAEAVSDLQTLLGNHQDTVVAESWLRETAAAIPASSLVAGELIAQQCLERICLLGRVAVGVEDGVGEATAQLVLIAIQAYLGGEDRAIPQ